MRMIFLNLTYYLFLFHSFSRTFNFTLFPFILVLIPMDWFNFMKHD